MPRSRRSRSSLAMQEMVDNDWRKYKRCFVCRHMVCVNNHPDRKPRLRPEDKIMGEFVCVSCRTRNPHMARQFIRMAKVLRVIGKTDDLAKRIVSEYDEYKIPREHRHLGRY